MGFLELKIPPPIVMIIFLVPVYYLDSIGVGAYIQPEIIALLYILPMLAGVTVAAIGIIEFNKKKTTINPHKPQETSALVTSGIYQFTRNPMYVGLSLIFLGVVLKIANLYGFVGVILYMLYLTRFQIAPEERTIEKMFGEEYLTYKKQVRRWL